MQLIVLGLIVTISILIYAIIRYVREFHPTKKSIVDRIYNWFRMRGSASYKDVTDEQDNSEHEKTLYFPTENVETEKHKRNIH